MKPHALPLSAALLASLLAACGGSDMLPEEAVAAEAVQIQTVHAADPVPPLVDDEGQPMPVAAPFGAGRRVASAAQIELLERGRADSLVRVWVDGFGLEAVQRAGVVVAHGPAAADSLGATAMVLVAAAEPERAAAVAERLLARGLTQVWQVAP